MEIKSRSELWKLLPKNPVIAEVGVAEGLYSREIYSWGPSKLLLVDMWESHPEFPGDAGNDQKWHSANFDNVMMFVNDRKDVKIDLIEILRGPSVAMAQHIDNATFDLVYIDACHSYECVVADIMSWAPKVKPGGIIAFHDILSEAYGVNRAVYEWAREINKEVHIIPENQPCDASAWIQL